MPTINQWTEIDQDFPVAGQDNESQGFRDNFSSIKDSLQAIELAVNVLDQTSVRLNEPNEFDADATISRVKFSQCAEEIFVSTSPVINNQDISYQNGSFQRLIIGNSDNLVFTIRDFPLAQGSESGRYARMRVEFVLNSSTIVNVGAENLQVGSTYTITSLGTLNPLINQPIGEINLVAGTSYRIVTIGNLTNWSTVSGLAEPKVGDTFTAGVNGTVNGRVIVNPTNFVELGATESKIGVTFTVVNNIAPLLRGTGTALPAKKINFIPANKIKYDDSFPINFYVTSSDIPKVIEFWSYNGDEIFAKYLGSYGDTRRSASFESVNVNGNSVLGSDVQDIVRMVGIPKIPVLTQGQIDLIQSPEVGMIIFNDTPGIKRLQIFTDDQGLTSGGAGNENRGWQSI
jgi:hypothetical protein